MSIDPNLVAVIASCVTVIVMIIALWQTSIIIGEMGRSREGQAFPAITINANFNTIVIENEGPGIAKDVTLTFTYEGPTAIPDVRHEPFNLGVGKRREFSAGYFPDLIGEYYVTVKVEYKDIYGKPFNLSDRFPLVVGVKET